MKIWAMPCRAPKTDRSWWIILTKHGPLEKGMAIHFSILALKTPWTVWSVKKIWHYITGYHRNFCLVTQSCPIQLSATPCTAAHQASLSFTISWSFLRLTSIESVMLSNHLILCHPLHDWVYNSFKKKMKNICNFASEYSLKYQITESWWKYGGRM